MGWAISKKRAKGRILSLLTIIELLSDSRVSFFHNNFTVEVKFSFVPVSAVSFVHLTSSRAGS